MGRPIELTHHASSQVLCKQTAERPSGFSEVLDYLDRVKLYLPFRVYNSFLDCSKNSSPAHWIVPELSPGYAHSLRAIHSSFWTSILSCRLATALTLVLVTTRKRLESRLQPARLLHPPGPFPSEVCLFVLGPGTTLRETDYQYHGETFV